ncbi:hypothetical protein, partial [Lactiplantibacillus plantarum]|uniref:hypothetical protein n=1 Tax=Lactiplantibacillus plantarum TaxID=1590 RepID=UPI003EC5956A
ALSLDLLNINGGDEAGSFPNLDQSDNCLPMSAAAKIDWKQFPYSAILVLGDGPDVAGQPISPGGKLRAERAAQLFTARQAPFI